MFHAPGVPISQSGANLDNVGTTTFDANGNAQVFIGPERALQQWHITRLVTTAGAVGDSIELIVYRNSAVPSNIIDSTLQGTQATSETDITLSRGHNLVCVWSGGTPGTEASIIVSGEILY